jgi:predicted ATPase/DNA-binding SARP family transcriptional activator
VAAALEFRLLGPLEAVRDGEVLPLGAPKQRALLAVLLLRAGQPVSVDVLAEAVWPERPPADPDASVQVYVSQLRRVLGRETIVRKGPGYVLQLPPGQIDLGRFRELADEGLRALEAEDARGAHRLLSEALALWRGPALSDFHYQPFALGEAERLDEERLAALETRLEADLRLGRHGEVLGELERLAQDHPLREGPRALLMRALYGAGRQAEALDVYQAFRRLLGEELGIEPGPELKELERRILRQDPELARPKRRAFPGGTVTLLFTDIEGSTELLHELGDAYAEALAEHRCVLREAFGTHGGVEVDTQGDAFFVAFARASDAIGAAEKAQQALAEGPVRVRMGIHTGEPIVTEEGYVGVDVHKGARIAAAGHGGQVLLSASTRDLVDVDVRDLGEHRLKDLTAPERLYQLGHDGFPPLKTLDATNLPVAASPLLGRERELDELLNLLGNGSRLVTVTGPGGTGKTRLALQVAAELVGSFEHGVFWVPLAALTDAELVVPQIAQTIGARDELAEHVRDKELLLLVDNLEHLLHAAPALGEVLGRARRLRLLVTSRAPLHIRGEREYPLDPLAETDAVTLFVERAREAGRDLELDDTVAAICRRLDSLPLAIELAAARTKLLGPATLLERLDYALPLLTSGARDAPERQQTLRATIEWSYDLLDDDAKGLFARVSVFAGSFSLEAAEDVCDADVDALAALVDLSLLKPIGESRFLMLETIREYALELLDERADVEEIRCRHAEHFAALAEAAAPHLRGSREQRQWVDRLERDYANVRAAVRWCFDNAPDAAMRIAANIAFFAYVHGGVAEARGWLDRALALELDTDPRLRANALEAGANLAQLQGDYRAATRFADESFALYSKLGDEFGVASALREQAKAVTIAGDLNRAKDLYAECVALAERIGDEWNHAVATNNLGDIALREEEWERAFVLCGTSREVRLRLGDGWGSALTLLNVALAEFYLRRADDARRDFRQALVESVDAGFTMLVGECLQGVAAAVAHDRPREAARILGAARATADDLGLLWSGDPTTQRMLEETEAAVRSKLGPVEWTREFENGRGMNLDDATRLALDVS